LSRSYQNLTLNIILTTIVDMIEAFHHEMPNGFEHLSAKLEAFEPYGMDALAARQLAEFIASDINNSENIQKGLLTERSPEWVEEKLLRGGCVLIFKKGTLDLASVAFLENETGMFVNGDSDIQICAVKRIGAKDENGAGAFAFAAAAALAHKRYPEKRIITWVHENGSRQALERGIPSSMLHSRGIDRIAQREYFRDEILDDTHQAFEIVFDDSPLTLPVSLDKTNT